MVLHAFVVMPFGIKEGIDFDQVYASYIRPALVDAGFLVFRADEEQRAGNIRADMFQELLMADLVIADLSIDNPNVWYELGVRHALRSRGVLLVQGKRDYQPFDIYTDRKLRYRLRDGAPDPETLEQDRKALTAMARSTAAAWHGRKISPVYKHLEYLQEPDWKSLSLDGSEITEHGFRYRQWQDNVIRARRKRRPGDVMVFAGEAPVQALALEAHRQAGKSLLEAGQAEFALEQINRALEVAPEDTASLQLKTVLLNRVGRREAARGIVDRLLDRDNRNAENWALLGRITKETWIETWRTGEREPAAMREAAREEAVLLGEAAAAYQRGYLCNTAHYYSGVNAYTLRWLLSALGEPDEDRIPLEVLEGGVRCALASALACELPRRKDYWARASAAEIETLCGEPRQVKRAWENAVVAQPDWFALDSSHQQLSILRDLDLRGDAVDAALKVVEKAMQRLEREVPPDHVFLFSGHMVDEPGRDPPRFPNDERHIDIARRAIAGKLDDLQLGAGDLALCGGACGGDLLFAELALQRGARVEMRLPFAEPTFLQHSVNNGGAQWCERYYSVRNHERCRVLLMPEELGEPPPSVDPYERDNLWQLYTALSYGAENVRFVCLWDGRAGDGPGGTQHMYNAVKDRSGLVFILDTTRLW